MLATLREKRLLVPTLMTLCALPILMLLGMWQLARKEWKENVLTALAERAGAPPLSDAETRELTCDLPELVGILQSCDFRRVKVRGAFDHSGERHLFAGVQRTKDGQMPGYWVFTPFMPSGLAAPPHGKGSFPKPILINRGFVPEVLKPAAARQPGQVSGEIEITAHVRTREFRRWSDATNDEAKNIYFVRDPRELGRLYGKQANGMGMLSAGWFYLEMVEGAPEGGYPAPLAGKINLPNRHLEYAITWFGLAGALAAVFAAFVVARIRGG